MPGDVVRDGRKVLRRSCFCEWNDALARRGTVEYKALDCLALLSALFESRLNVRELNIVDG